MADVTQPDMLTSLPAADTLLYAVGFDRSSGKSMREIYVQGLQNVLDALAKQAELRRVIYISTTGVYGPAEGDVDETSPCEPTREGGQVCLAAERLLTQHALGKRSIILRLAGIYGPGRVPNRASLLAGEPIVAAAESRLNLIHVDDAVATVLAAQRQAKPPALYLVADGSPPTRRDYYQEGARRIGAPQPTLMEPEAADEASSGGSPSRSARAHDASAKRIANAKMLRELGVTLTYPTFREGLSHALQTP